MAVTGQASTLLTIPRISIRVGITLAVAIVAATVAFVFVPSPYREALLFLAAACAAAGQLAVALYTARLLQLTMSTQAGAATELAAKEARLEERYLMDAAARFAERWNDATMYHVRAQCREIIEKRHDPEEVRKIVEGDDSKQTNVRNIMNFLEELALAVTENRCHEAYAKRLFSGIVVHMWRATEGWVRELRRRRDRPQIWVELEALYARWNA